VDKRVRGRETFGFWKKAVLVVQCGLIFTQNAQRKRTNQCIYHVLRNRIRDNYQYERARLKTLDLSQSTVGRGGFEFGKMRFCLCKDDLIYTKCLCRKTMCCGI
jgi:hypothetical protein